MNINEQYAYVWQQLTQSAKTSNAYEQTFLSTNLWQTMIAVLTQIVASPQVNRLELQQIFDKIIADNKAMNIVNADCSVSFHPIPIQQSLLNYLDFIAKRHFDNNYWNCLLYSVGLQAIALHKLMHGLWYRGQHFLAQYIQSRVSKQLRIDCHPLAIIGERLDMAHCSGIVIGATAVVEDDVSLNSLVTLGGNGKERENRHPKVRSGVKIGSGSQLLGNIIIGNNSVISPDTIVLKDVPPNSSVSGVPAKIVQQKAIKKTCHSGLQPANSNIL